MLIRSQCQVWAGRGSSGQSASVVVSRQAASIGPFSSPSRFHPAQCAPGAAQYEDMDDFEQMLTTGGGWTSHRTERCGAAGQIKGRLGVNEYPYKTYGSLPAHSHLLVDVAVILGDTFDWEKVHVEVDHVTYGEPMAYSAHYREEVPLNMCGRSEQETFDIQTVRVPHTQSTARVRIWSNMNSAIGDEFFGVLYVNVRTEECSTCDFGFLGSIPPCAPCPAGTFKRYRGAGSCTNCNAGETSDPGAGSCRSVCLHRAHVQHTIPSPDHMRDQVPGRRDRDAGCASVAATGRHVPLLRQVPHDRGQPRQPLRERRRLEIPVRRRPVHVQRAPGGRGARHGIPRGGRASS